MPASFAPNDRVRRIHQPDEIGTVLEVTEDPFDGELSYRVLFGHRATQCFAENLISADDGPTDPWSAITRGIVGPARDLRTLLTTERLRRPMGAVGASFGTARVKLYPYQFKPLVKFLDNPHHGLLIADEVGLGKTIEAGYILREWGERHQVDTVLILVPARLRTKWHDEMKRRFDLEFDIVDRKTVRKHLRRAERSGTLEPFRWIASYESLRDVEVIELFETLSPAVDLLVLDEAHRVRNRGTKQYRLAKALRGSAMAMLLLTATPVQTGLDNLYTLVDLLEPGIFGSADNFAMLVEENKPILEASRAAAEGRFDDAATHLLALQRGFSTRALGLSAAVGDLVDVLRQTKAPSRADRVALQASIAELSLTGHLITRTLKKDVFEKRAERRARSIAVRMSPSERQVYSAVRDVTALLLHGRSSFAQTMASLTAFRYTASSIPAGYEYMRERLRREGLWLDAAAIEDEDDLELDDFAFAAPAKLLSTDQLRKRIQKRLARCPEPRGDTKLQQLRRSLDEVWADDRAHGRPLRKVIVFAFFKRTLAWLSVNMRRWEWAHEHIDGGVKLEEREERIARFLESPEVRVLLSSEVGGEGLDMQKASVVVNYDLPWNPMVVEQRIGRVDRIGQTSDVILVLNLTYEGTVEERILNRLYDRVRIYEEAIGEMEEILGPRLIAELVELDLRGDLSEDELERRIEHARMAVEKNARHTERLTAQVDGIVSADQGILDQLRRMIDGHKLPSPADVLVLLHGFLAQNYPGSLIDGDPVQGIAQLELSAQARKDFKDWSLRNHFGGQAFAQRLSRGPVSFTVDGDGALSHPRAEFIQTRHPLVQFAVEQTSRRAVDGGQAFRAVVRSSRVAPGHWLVGLWTVLRSVPHDDAEISACAMHLGTGERLVGAAAEPLLQGLLAGAKEQQVPPDVERSTIEAAGKRLRSEFGRLIRTRRDEVARAAERRATRRRVTWEATLQSQVDRASQHLNNMRSSGKAFAIKMAEAKLKKREQELLRLREELAITDRVELDNEELAVVMVEVVDAP